MAVQNTSRVHVDPMSCDKDFSANTPEVFTCTARNMCNVKDICL